MKINIQKLKSSLFGANKTSSKYDINFSRDWLLSIFVFAVILILIFVFGIYILFNIDKNVDTEVELKSYIETINRSKLQNVLDEYSTKRDTFDKFISKRIKFIDPSL
jgi:preprotein translocase subunit SecF